MTPFELRFEIFKQAESWAQSQYIADFERVQRHNEINEDKWDYPIFPSYEKIEEFANKINVFISSK